MKGFGQERPLDFRSFLKLFKKSQETLQIKPATLYIAHTHKLH